MIKGSIQEEDKTIVNIYASNIGEPQYIRKILTAIKGEINSNTVIVGDFFLNKFIYIIYLFLTALGLHCCTQVFSSCSELG